VRHVVIALAVVLAGLPAYAGQSATLNAQLRQVERGAAQPPPSTIVRTTTQPDPPQPPTPPPQVVAPPITYPFPPLMAPPSGGLTPRVGEGPPFRTFTPIFNPSGSPFFGPFVGGYLDFPSAVARKPRGRVAPAPPATGLLRLSVTPLTAQVFVDSFYVGTVEDINTQNVLQLEAGPHRIEIRAPQHQTLTFDIRILPYETVTYRGALEPVRLAPPAAPAAGGPSTRMYVIPNCYVGNVPPRPSRLAPGCDIKQVQVLGPK